MIRALGRDFPEVNVISVREQLEAATELFDRLALAVRGAAAVAALAGLLVLTGPSPRGPGRGPEKPRRSRCWGRPGRRSSRPMCSNTARWA